MPALISRDEAASKGMLRYFTGQPCRKGHLSERYTLSGSCIDCMVAWHNHKRDSIKAAMDRARRAKELEELAKATKATVRQAANERGYE